jgi:soluble lytic murein transglycosylase-like protein
VRDPALMAGYFSVEVAQRGIDNGGFWNPWIVTAAATAGIEVSLIKAVISAESAWDPGAVSSNVSSFGIMQVNAGAHNIPPEKLLTDYEFSLNYGATVLGDQVRKRHGDLVLALAGYNAGTGRSDADLRARYDANTLGVKTYVDTVLAYLAWFRANDPLVTGAGVTTPNDPLTESQPAWGGAGAADPLVPPTKGPGPGGMPAGSDVPREIS